MDVRCFRYHLKILVHMFNERRIDAEKFEKNFLTIRPFKSGNKAIVKILLLGLKDNKRKENIRWTTSKSKILCKH